MKQNEGFNFFRAALLVPGLMLLTIAPAAIAQMHGGGMGGSQNPGPSPNNNMNNPNGTMAPDGMQPMGAPSAQNAEQMMQRNIFDNLRRNFDVETKLSKMALKNSTNDDVKKFAQQVVHENRGLSNQLIMPGSVDQMYHPEVVPEQTRKAEKQMKKTTGKPFDEIYLVQMNAYVKNDKEVAEKASSMSNSAKVNEVGVHLQSVSDQRETQIASLTKEDGFTIK